MKSKRAPKLAARQGGIPWRVVSFGFLMTLSSALGQTHFLSLFNPDLRLEFSLSHGEIGSIYSVATLCSAVLLSWLGRLLDSHDMRYYTAAVVCGLALAIATLASAHGVFMLFLSFFLLRLFGQGLSVHTGNTATARLAQAHRGKSLSIAGLGLAAGEFIAPIAVGAALVTFNWRQIWYGAALIELVVVMAIAQWLLHKLDHRPPSGKKANEIPDFDLSWTRSEVIRDKRFWCFAPSILSPAFLVTALLFHQASLAEAKGIDFLTWIAGFTVYPIVTSIAALASGHLIDRFGSVWVVRRGMPLFILGMAVPVLLDFKFTSFVYYAVIGAGTGMCWPAYTALWREIYGSAHLGANLAMSQALTVLSTAAGPITIGLMLDAKLSWPAILGLCIAFASVAYLLLLFTKLTSKAPSKRRANKKATRRI